MCKNKYDILEEYISSLQKEQAPNMKKIRGNAELEKVIKTARDLKVLAVQKTRGVQPKFKKEKWSWSWLLAPAVTVVVIMSIFILNYKSFQNLNNNNNNLYIQELSDLTDIEQELDQNLRELDYYLELEDSYQNIERTIL